MGGGGGRRRLSKEQRVVVAAGAGERPQTADGDSWPAAAAEDGSRTPIHRGKTAAAGGSSGQPPHKHRFVEAANKAKRAAARQDLHVMVSYHTCCICCIAPAPQCRIRRICCICCIAPAPHLLQHLICCIVASLQRCSAATSV